MKIRWAHVLRDTGMVWAFVFFTEVIITILYRGHLTQDMDAFRSVVTAKKTAIILGFVIAGLLGVTDQIATVRGSRIKPDKNDLHYRSLTVKSTRSHHKIFVSLPVPS